MGKKEYSQQKGNLEVVPQAKTSPPIIIKTLNILTKEHRLLNRPKKMRLVSDLALIILVGVFLILGSSYLISNYQFNRNIFLEIQQTNSIITSGRLETFEFDYHNRNKSEVNKARVTIIPPQDFKLISVIPANVFDFNTNTFDLGELSSGANGKLKIKGIVLGEVATQQRITFSFNYNYLGQPRTYPISYNYLIEDSVLDVQAKLPPEIYQGVVFPLQLEIQNSGEEDLTDLEIELSPSDFEIRNIDTSLEARFQDQIIYINQLAAGESSIINLDMVANDFSGRTDFNILTYLISSQSRLQQREINREITVEVPNFTVAIQADREVMTIDNQVKFNFSCLNREAGAISEIKFNLAPQDNNFIIQDIQALSSNIRVENQAIILNGELVPNQRANFSIQVEFQQRNRVLNPAVYLKAEANYNLADQTRTYLLNSPRIKYLSDLQLKSAAYYYSPQGDQLGIGPLPPIVDIPTNYWIFWEVDNYGNDLDNFTWSARLPRGVVWTDNKSLLAGNLRYGEISRRVVWEIDQIDQQDGKYLASFEVSLISEVKDIGQVLDLLTNIEYYSYDTYTGQDISGVLENLDTDLKYDNLANGQGKIQNLGE